MASTPLPPQTATGAGQSLEGQLTSDAHKALLAAEEAAEDRCHKPLQEWGDTLASVCKNPSWLSYLLKKNRVALLDPLLRWGIRNSLSRGVRVASAYVEAHRRMLSSLQGRKVRLCSCLS